MARKETVSTTEYTFTAVFEPAEEGGYVVTFPAIAHLATQGETLEEARAMAVDCLRCFIEGHQKDSLPIPTEAADSIEPIREKVTVKLSAA